MTHTNNENKKQKQVIVLIDDDDIIRMVIKAYLEEEYIVEDFDGAQGALAFLRDTTPDLILSDINMPDMNGLELRDALNDFSHLEAIPFIFLTGSSDDDLRQKARALGIDDFVTKPVNKDDLFNAIRPTLRRRAQVENALGKMLDEKVTESLKPSLLPHARGFDMVMESQEASAGGGDLVLHIPHKDFDFVIVADVMGHGVEAKFFAHAYAGYIYGLMRSLADNISPEGFLERLNKAIYDDSLLEKSMLTVCVAQLFPDGRVVLAGAGHPSPLLITDDGVYEMECDGMLLGALDNSTYETAHVDLSKGGRLLLFSDGLIELPTMLEDPDGVYKAVSKTLGDTRDQSLQESADALQAYYKHECKDEGLRDDVTYVLLECDQKKLKKSQSYDGYKQLFSMMMCIGVMFLLGACSEWHDYTKSEEFASIKTSFDTPVHTVFEEREEGESFLDDWSANMSYSRPLEKQIDPTTASGGSGSQGARASSGDTVNLTATYNPLTYWFFRGTASQYVNNTYQNPWNGDFSYAFGYDDWHSDTLSLTYSNYGGNRWSPDRDDGERFTRLEEGNITLGYKWNLNEDLTDWVSPFDDGAVGCDVNYNLTPRFGRLQNADKRGHWKQFATFGCKWSITGWWYLNWRLNYYPQGDEHQQPWDPDYTYGFGYFDWHAGTVSVQYNNYAGNRFPWRDSADDSGAGDFENGSITVSYSFDF